MNSFFGEERNEDWSQAARDFDREVGLALQPIIDKWLAAGYSTRQMEHIITSCAFEMCVVKRLCLEE